MLRKARDAATGASGACNISVADSDAGIPDQIGDYQVLGVLGAGGQAVVYRAWHPRLHAEIAVKKLLASDGPGDDALVHEAVLLSSVKNAAFPRPLDLIRVDSESYLLLELIHGEPLASQGLRLSARDIFRVIRQIVTAVGDLHAAQLLHLDLSPSNVLIDEHGDIRLIDFGLARKTPAPDRTALRIGGTPGFVAPEIFEGKATIDHRADLYGVGALVYFLLHGTAPSPVRPSDRLRPGLADDSLAIRMKKVCLTALDPDVTRRCQTADDFLLAWDAIAKPRPASHRWLAVGMLSTAILLGPDPRTIESARADVLVVRPAGEGPLGNWPELQTGDAVAFAFKTPSDRAELMIRTPSGRHLRLAPFEKGPEGRFRFPPSGGATLKKEMGTYVVFFAPVNGLERNGRLLEALRRLPAPPRLTMGRQLSVSRGAAPGMATATADERRWIDAVQQCEKQFSGLVAIAFPVR